ncbi:MAG: malto-oligosyltrehalose synthase [Casimicrobiaceae bacterium]
MSDALTRLATHYGIVAEYTDVWAKPHPTSPQTMRALLGAMGCPVEDDAAAEAKLAAFEASHWSEALPPVQIWKPGAPREVRVQLPGARSTRALGYRVQEENGAEHAGDITAGQLLEVGRNDADVTAYRLSLDLALPEGYHRLILQDGEEVLGGTVLIVAPAACYEPPALGAGSRIFGPAVQLYGVRSRRNWGFGDFTDLATIVEQWGAQGANVVGVNPLHALFPHDPAQASPYSPSSRLSLNTLYIDVEVVADFAECEPARQLVASEAFQARLAALRQRDTVDYPAVASAKEEVLHILAAHFIDHHLARGTPRATAFRTFVVQGGEALERLALFEALQAHLHARDGDAWGWPVWPEAYRDPDSPAVRGFAQQHRAAIDAALYRQWQADVQVQAAAERARDHALELGLYRDLAVSVNRGGAEAWSSQSLYAVAAGVGAPPDIFSPHGQNWGLPPLIPNALRDTAYAPFIATLRANMRHAGALRIDHVMGLARLYWVPEGQSAANGAYVRYPLDDLIAVLALESQRQRCLIVGEDLGTVSEEVRQALMDANVLSYKLLWFEREGDVGFLPPADYAAQALVTVTTHDLPTVGGWWRGFDIDAREERGLFSRPEQAGEARTMRSSERRELLEALAQAGVATPGWERGQPVPDSMTPELGLRLQQFLAIAPSKVMMVQLEDVMGVEEQVNLPGTTDTYPNWQSRLPVSLERWMDDRRFVDLTRMLRRARGTTTRDAQPAAPAAGVRVPRSTYRLQLHREFTLRDATALVPYLAQLGISHVYCSPYLRARPGSRHGYDIVDHASINPEIGDSADLDAFVETLTRHGMSHLLDMVPNHMGVMGSDNAWWMDVLENGPGSLYAEYFDIDWTTGDADVGARVLIPVLGDHYGSVLERGELKVSFEAANGAFAVRYYTHRLPLDPRTYRPLLERARQLARDLPPSATSRLVAVLTGIASLPGRIPGTAAKIQARHEAKEAIKAQLARLVADNDALRGAIDTAIAEWNGTPGDAPSMERLHELLEAQAFRVAFWRVASDEINYRRFFDINDLAALRVENEAVFEATHRFVMGLAAAGKVDGLRIDHPDGLHDPARYFARLQEYYTQATGGTPSDAARQRPLYVVVEKILAAHEDLPLTWAIHGTTGYRFANLANGVCVDTAAKSRVDRAWRAFVRDEAVDWDDATTEGKLAVMQGTLASELNVLTHRLLQIARADRHTRDFTFNVLRQAVMDVTAAFPVYRTYVSEKVGSHDRRHIEWAVARARRRSRAADVSVFEFLRNVLLVRPPEHTSEVLRGAYRAFAMRFQQFTSPVTAKGVEDTALYVFNRLVSLNEVGGDPDHFGTSVSAFHAANAHRATHWPHTLIATSTHDNKRSEDVRARIDLISEVPGAWRLLVRRWSRLNRSKKRTLEGQPAPSRNDEYLIYQTLVGSLPRGELDAAALEEYRERLKAYAVKASRESKVSTSWINVNVDYEAALAGFLDGLLAPGERNLFLADLTSQRTFFAWFGLLNSIVVTALKLTSPGVPDIYQGNELLDFSLVDPDNRRPVDYGLRARELTELDALAKGRPERLPAAVRSLFTDPEDGRAKLWVVRQGLQLRNDHPQLFRDGDYHALAAEGAKARHVLAFARRHGDDACVVVCGRLFAALGAPAGTLPGKEDWGDTSLPRPIAGTDLYRDTLTGRIVRAADAGILIGDLLVDFPVALLVPERFSSS